MKEAAAIYRHELKYYIGFKDYLILSHRLKAILKKDPFADHNNEYHVRSLYLDDIYDSALFEKLAGVESRKKYRIRIYNKQGDVIKLEKKCKHGHLTYKESSLITKDQYLKILENDIDFLKLSDNKLLNNMYLEFRNKLLKPIVIVDYIREAYVHPLQDIRITFDKNLRTGLGSRDIFNSDLTTISAFDDSEIIMEVKFNRFLPQFIKDFIQIQTNQRSAISKYVICRKHNKINSWEDN